MLDFRWVPASKRTVRMENGMESARQADGGMRSAHGRAPGTGPAERVLRVGEDLFRQFSDHSTDVLTVFDAGTMRCEYVSPAYERIWGERRENLLQGSTSWHDATHPDDRADLAAAVDQVRQGDVCVREYRIVRPDGGIRWIRDTLFPMPDEHGRVQRIGGISEDLTRPNGNFVYVVDADERSRQDLACLLRNLGYDVRAFPTGKTFLEIASALRPGCVVLDVRAPDAGGLVLPRELKARRIGLPVIVLGDAGGDVAFGVQVMKAGAVDFLPAPYDPDQLLAALTSAAAEIRSTERQSHAAGHVQARIAAMPPREREVLEGLLRGGTNKSIARALGISPRTVELHRSRVMQRLGAQTLSELVLIATATGVFPPL